MGLRATVPRDATDSWAGYLYQSVLGLVVVLEKILGLHDSNQAVNGHFVYEDVEDFSIYIKDATGNVVESSTHQAKYNKSQTPSDYYSFISQLNEASIEDPNLQYFLNISSNVTFLKNPKTTVNTLPNNYISYVYSYRNGNRYLGGHECLAYLESLINEYCQKKLISITQEQIEKKSALLLAFIDSIIIETKEQRINTPAYRREIQFQEILNQITAIMTELTQEHAVKIIKKRFFNACQIYCDSLSGEEFKRVDSSAKSILALDDKSLISLVKKIHFHKDLTALTDLASSFLNAEDLQEILFEVIKSVSSQLELENLIFRKGGHAYRPSTLRAARNQTLAENNLKLDYLPKIKRNMAEYDIQGFFETKKIIIDGQTIDDIWSFEITSSGAPRQENKINEPELTTLISVQDAIKELS